MLALKPCPGLTKQCYIIELLQQFGKHRIWMPNFGLDCLSWAKFNSIKEQSQRQSATCLRQRSHARERDAKSVIYEQKDVSMRRLQDCWHFRSTPSKFTFGSYGHFLNLRIDQMINIILNRSKKKYYKTYL